MVVTGKVFSLQVEDALVKDSDRGGKMAAKPKEIHHINAAAAIEKPRNQNRADIAGVAGSKTAHVTFPFSKLQFEALADRRSESATAYQTESPLSP